MSESTPPKNSGNGRNGRNRRFAAGAMEDEKARTCAHRFHAETSLPAKAGITRRVSMNFSPFPLCALCASALNLRASTRWRAGSPCGGSGRRTDTINTLFGEPPLRRIPLNAPPASLCALRAFAVNPTTAPQRKSKVTHPSTITLTDTINTLFCEPPLRRLAEAEGDERWNLLRQCSRELAVLRRADLLAAAPRTSAPAGECSMFPPSPASCVTSLLSL